MSLGDASRALEIVDARLTATQSKLSDLDANMDPEFVNLEISKIIDHLDLIIGDVRAAAAEIVKHTCEGKMQELVDQMGRSG